MKNINNSDICINFAPANYTIMARVEDFFGALNTVNDIQDERYSHLEYERMLRHRNYRINLVNLEDEWSVV